NAVPEGRTTVRCTSCHVQHGDHSEERATAKGFSKLALQRPWQDATGQDLSAKPISDLTRSSKSSSGLLIAALSAAGGIPLVLVGVVYFMTNAKRRAYIVGLAAVAASPPPAPKKDEWGVNAAAVVEADRIIRKGEAA